MPADIAVEMFAYYGTIAVYCCVMSSIEPQEVHMFFSWILINLGWNTLTPLIFERNILTSGINYIKKITEKLSTCQKNSYFLK